MIPSEIIQMLKNLKVDANVVALDLKKPSQITATIQDEEGKNQYLTIVDDIPF